MVFSVQQAVADLDLPPFEFEDAEGTPQQLPHVKMLSPAQAYRVLYQGEFAQVLNELSPGQGDAVEKLPAAVIERLFEAWQEHSGVDLSSPGKPATPLQSGRSTATPSKRTARSAGSRLRK